MSEAGSHLAGLVSSTISDKVVVDCTDCLALSFTFIPGTLDSHGSFCSCSTFSTVKLATCTLPTYVYFLRLFLTFLLTGH